MSGFVQPQWSGFSDHEPPAPNAAGDDMPVAGHEIDRLVLGQPTTRQGAGAPGEACPQALPEAAQPLPVTPASPRPHKALIP